MANKSDQKRDERMRGIEEIKRDGKVTGYKFRCCVGRIKEPGKNVYKQVWRTTSISKNDPRIDGLTPGKLLNELSSIKHEWDKEKKEEFEKNYGKTDMRNEKQTITLKKYVLENWMQTHIKQSKLKPSTKAFYEFMADDIIGYFKDQIFLKDINREAVELYEIYLRNKAKTKKGKNLSDTTVRRHLETLRNILRYAKVNKYITEDPFSDYSIEDKSEEAKSVDYLAPSEINSFYEHLEGESTFWQLYIRISLLCGLRRGEMVALQWGDIEEDNRRILVQRNVTVDAGSETGYNIGTTKTKKKRVVFYTEEIGKLLECHKSEQISKFGTLPQDAFVFCSSVDVLKPIYPTTPTTWLKRFEQKHGLHEVSPHDLRHTNGTLAQMAGFSTKDIQTELGHSDSKTTEKFYVGIDEGNLQNIPKFIENVINNQAKKEQKKEK